MINQLFSHKKTGVILTQIPLMEIGEYEKYDGTAAYYSAEKNVVISILNKANGLTYYGGQSRADILAEYPDAELLTIDEAGNRHQAPYIEPVEEITEEKYWYWLEVLFPEDWQHNGGESFKVSERTCGDITRICCSLNDSNKHARRYFTLCDSYQTPHKAIVERCREYMRANP